MAGSMSRGDEHFAKSEAIAVFDFLDLEFVLCAAFVTRKNSCRFQSRAELA